MLKKTGSIGMMVFVLVVGTPAQSSEFMTDVLVNEFRDNGKEGSFASGFEILDSFDAFGDGQETESRYTLTCRDPDFGPSVRYYIGDGEIVGEVDPLQENPPLSDETWIQMWRDFCER